MAAAIKPTKHEALEAVVANLEEKSKENLLAYKVSVAWRAGLGFAVIGLVLVLAIALIAGYAALPFVLWNGGFHQAVLIFRLLEALALLAIPIWLLVRSIISALTERFPIPQGIEVKRQDVPKLFDALDDMRKQMQGPAFHHVLINDELNAAVIQRPLIGFLGPSTNYLVLGLPLMEILTPKEALAVVAHEYGHLAGAHGRFASYIYRLRKTWATMHAVSQRWKGYAADWMRRVVDWYVPYFNAYTFVLARANEYEADAASSMLVGKQAAANALLRVQVAGLQYSEFVSESHKAVRLDPIPPSDFLERWSEQARDIKEADAARWFRISMAQESAIGDTHPALKDRLVALLGTDVVKKLQPPGPLNENSSAQEWLANRESAIRDSVQQHWRKTIARAWEARHDEIQTQKNRLTYLRKLENPDIDQFAERLRIQVDLESEENFENDVETFKKTFPQSGVGAFLRGRWLLLKENEIGLEELERSIELSPNLTKPACELAYHFLLDREDARAANFKAKWLERDRWEIAVLPQLNTLDVTHELRSADLSEADLQTVVALMKTNRAGISKAYLARRILPADPDVKTYVIGIELEKYQVRTEFPNQIVNRVASTDGWPVQIQFCVLKDKFAVLVPKLKAIEGSEIDISPLSEK